MVNTKRSFPSSNQESGGMTTLTRMRSSLKRPRAPIACIRCHHKKIRCDGEHPNCARCTQGGILCAYPSSRRSRNTPPASMDPFIDNLSQLEIKIHQIEANLKHQRRLFLSFKMVYPSGAAPMATKSLLDTQETQSKSTKNSISSDAQPSYVLNHQVKAQSQSEMPRKRSSPSSNSQSSSGLKSSKRQKRSLNTAATPKLKTSPSSSFFPLSPSSTSSRVPMNYNDYTGHAHSSSFPQSYVSSALGPFACQTEWPQSTSPGSTADVTSWAVYSGRPQQAHPSMYNAYHQRPFYLPQQISPVTTPDYTDDNSDQFNLATPAPHTPFHYASPMTSKLNTDHHQHPYSLSTSIYPPHTLVTTNSLPAQSSSYSSSCPQVSQQTTSCQMIDLYNHLTMDDLISFDTQNNGLPLLENAVWYC